MNSSISVITYNVSDVNAPMKKQVVRMDQKIQLNSMLVYKKPTLNMKTYINKNTNKWRKYIMLTLIRKSRSSYINFRHSRLYS